MNPTCSPDRQSSGRSPPPDAVSRSMLALNTSAFVVMSNGPKPGHHKGEWILVSWLRLVGHPDMETGRHVDRETHRRTDSQAG